MLVSQQRIVPTLITKCDNCGKEVLELRCEIQCPYCGFAKNCSDA